MMRADGDEFKAVFGENWTFERLTRCKSRTRAAVGQKLVAAVMSRVYGHPVSFGPPVAHVMVHSTTIAWDAVCETYAARWKIRHSPGVPHVLVLFAAAGIFVYRLNPLTVQVLRVPGKNDHEIIDKLDRTFVQSAYISWGTPDWIPVDVSVAAADKATIRRQQIELAAARTLIAQLLCADRVSPAVPVMYAPAGCDSFHTYDRDIRGFIYEFSDDFRPDIAPAAQWDSNLLYRYMYQNKSKPDCIFPRIIRMVSCTPRFGTNCDFGVVFEHPVSKADVAMEMCKAFATVCREYRSVVFAFQLSLK